jgi:REP element-mobilizing transposase RayT
MWGIMQNKKCKLYRINGGSDHIHILVDIPPKIGVANFVKDLKVSSSIWLKQQFEFKQFEGWAEGYGGFTISHSDKDRVIDYIKNQKEHHKRATFMEEYKTLLKEYGIELDETGLI